MCWENVNSTPAEQSQCRATWDTYLNIIGEEYPRPWTPAVASRVEDEERRWANLPYETFVMRWNPSGQQLAGVGVVGLGGRVASAGSASFVLACVSVLVATGAVSIAIALPQRQPMDWGRVDATPGAIPIPDDRDIPRPTTTPENDDEDYYFRGTTIGFAGSSALQGIGVTPTTTQPGVATVFATIAETKHGGSGIVYIASSSDLEGIPILPSNVLSSYEFEVAFDMLPLDFATLASDSVSANGARAILGSMGIVVASRISLSEQSGLLQSLVPLSKSQIRHFVEQARITP